MKKFHEPFCGFPHGFHEYEDIGDEENTCVHCGRTKHEIEGEDLNRKEYTFDSEGVEVTVVYEDGKDGRIRQRVK